MYCNEFYVTKKNPLSFEDKSSLDNPRTPTLVASLIRSGVLATAEPAPQTHSVEQVHSVEQLRKMNINQLKTIALQLGITADISKLKKPELISLIRERENPNTNE